MIPAAVAMTTSGKLMGSSVVELVLAGLMYQLETINVQTAHRYKSGGWDDPAETKTRGATVGGLFRSSVTRSLKAWHVTCITCITL